MTDRPQDSSRRLVIVTGSGRSGTSTVAGTLKYLGLAVPQPEVKADRTNPRGFFEPRWVVDFHKRLLATARVRTLDARPEALKLTGRVGSRPLVREELRTWLGPQLEQHQVVVKDPRTFWFEELWTATATSLGVAPSYLTMLRHPTEVVGSRDTHYLTELTAEERRSRETGILAGWVNVVLVNEHLTRSARRVFVHYPELIESWRKAMVKVRDTLDLTFDTDLESDEPHQVDEFIDANLHRVRLTWDDLDVPPYLRVLAEDVWQGLCALADDPDDPTAKAALDQARERYAVLHAQSAALVHDATTSAVQTARRHARRQARLELSRQQRTSPWTFARRAFGAARALRDRRG